MISLTISLVAFVFLRDLGLGLSLRLTYISKREIVAGFSLIILMIPIRCVFLGGFVAF